MANTTIEAADGVMSKLISLFFKGMDRLLDSAIEYQNDNGVLKGDTTIPVKDKHGDDTEFVISLAPVDGKGSIREGTFVVNFSCEDVDDLITEIDGVNYQNAAIVIDEKTKDQFEEIVKKIFKANGLSKIPNKTEKVQDEESHKEIRRIDAETKQGKHVVVNVEVYQIPKTNRYDITMNADGDVERKFSPKEVKGSEKLVETIYDWFDKNGLTIQDDEDDDWLQSARNWDNEPIESSKKINMTLRKSITASETVVDLVKIYANYDIDEAMEAVDTVLDDEGFLESLDEGDNSLVVVDDGEDLDINPAECAYYTVASVTDILTASTALYSLLANYSLNFAEYQELPEAIANVLVSIADMNSKLESVIQPPDSVIDQPLVIQQSL